MAEEKPLTLDDFARTILDSHVNQMANKLINDGAFLEYLGKFEPPPTRKQRIRWWIEDKKQRAKDIWTILRGGDIHEDCGDY